MNNLFYVLHEGLPCMTNKCVMQGVRRNCMWGPEDGPSWAEEMKRE